MPTWLLCRICGRGWPQVRLTEQLDGRPPVCRDCQIALVSDEENA